MIQREGTNIQALDEMLRGQLGAEYLGLSTTPGEVRVHFVETAADQTLERARVITRNHDPAQLSPSQQAEVQRQQRLKLLRASNQAPLPEADSQSIEMLAKELAAKVRWLEQEIRDLRGI
jgi:hypothetical protein